MNTYWAERSANYYSAAFAASQDVVQRDSGYGRARTSISGQYVARMLIAGHDLAARQSEPEVEVIHWGIDIAALGILQQYKVNGLLDFDPQKVIDITEERNEISPQFRDIIEEAISTYVRLDVAQPALTLT